MSFPLPTPHRVLRRRLLAARVASTLVAGALLTACSSATTPNGGPQPLPACTFTNPVMSGADPSIVRHDGWYYLVQSRDDAIWVYKSQKLTEIGRNGVRVWSPPATGWNRANLWAPELLRIDGRWYIYYAAAPVPGGPFIHQRSGVLEATTDDPQGPYVDRGMLYTGDDVATGADPKWAIDVTVARLNGQLHAIWSGWEDNTPAPPPLSPDRKPQHLYIARMSDPVTISSNRVKLSSPTAPWEDGPELDLQEGPQFLEHGEDVFIVYSTRESWLPDYRLGLLRFANPDGDLLDPANVVKTGPVFERAQNVVGVGHNTFTVSPDGTEEWLVYHAKASSAPGWDRRIRMQKFTWNADGTPNFGTPVPSGEPIPVPSGECPTESAARRAAAPWN